MRCKPFIPTPGTVYDTPGASYLCLRLTGDGAWLRSLGSGWQFVAHGLCVDSEGHILWRCSTSGHFAEEGTI